VQCLKAEFRAHPTCIRLQEENRQRQEREASSGG